MKLLKGLLAALIIGVSFVNAQNTNTLSFVSGNFETTANIASEKYKAVDESKLVNGNYYRIIQFNTIPSTAQKEELKNANITLLNYMPNNAYYAQIQNGTDLNILQNYNAFALVEIQDKFKLTKKLNDATYEDWALNGNKIRLNAIYFDGISQEYVITQLNKMGAEVLFNSDNNTVRFEIALDKLNNLYKNSCIYYFEQIDAPGKPENLVGVTDHRSNNIATAYSSGLKYDGTGISVMLQDNSKLDDHIDYTGRFTDINATQSGDHGEHCGGTIAGAGNIDPTARGMAYGADVLVYSSSNNNYNLVPTIYASNNVTVTSKSYSNGVNAGYTSLAQQLDQQIRTLPNLTHVFSAGNSNGLGSTPAGSQWFNVTGGHKAGKNVITCANLTSNDVINSSSSRGPCQDGRIKPDISAVGTNVWSTNDPNNYVFKTGTSMSCPGVAGTIAQLCDAYKDLNAGVDPPSGLIKATVLNTADDIGNPGPDFIHGWGRINARRAFGIFNDNNYLSGSISQGGNNVHNITVPAGTDQVRVMVLWVDYEGAVSSSPSLVNNINFVLRDPSSTPYNPWVLDATPNATTLNLPAVRGVDNLNNMEQVTIDNPTAGTYNIEIAGFSIPQGPQTYYVVYEFVTDDVVLTYPIGGEGINHAVDEKIRWDAFGNSGTFNVEYSDDNGSSWNVIAAGVSASQRYLDWNVPNIVTGEALVRVTRGASSSQSHQPFSIHGVPTGLNVISVCPDSMLVSWNAVPGATGYEVSLLGAMYMDAVGTGTGTSLMIPAQSTVSHWWSVKALAPNNCEGRRANAVFQAAGQFNCVFAVDAGLAPRGLTNNSTYLSCMGAIIDVKINISNDGATSISNVPVHYTVNAGPAVNEVYTGTLAPGANVNYTFTTQITPAPGLIDLVVWNDLVGDGNSSNDSIISQFTYTLSTPNALPWSEDFETFTLCSTGSNCEADVCPTINDFINETNLAVDDNDWRTDEGGTPSAGTGPGTDFNPGTSTGNYLYLEASNCFNMQANLISPCIDLTSAINPQLTFAYHLFGSTMGELHVDIFMNGTWTNDITTAIVGAQGSAWLQRTESLTPYLGNIVNFRFRGVTGSNWASDMAIDDIIVAEPSSINENSLTNSFNIHPNPSNGVFHFEYNGDAVLLAKVIDANGRIINQLNLSPMQKGMLDLSDYANGLYLVVLSNGNNVITKKIIKE